MIDIVWRTKDESNFQRPTQGSHRHVCVIRASKRNKIRQRDSQIYNKENEQPVRA